MRKGYRILADVIAVGVAVQSMAMVWAIAGLFHWIEDGGTLDSKVMDAWEKKAPSFQGAVGFEIHGIVGMMVLPLVAVALLVVAFFARVDGGVRWAVITLALVVLQVVAGFAGEDAPWVGLVHGLNAFALFSVAIAAARAANPVHQTAVTAAP
jgi:hypothetical protein